MQNDYNLPPGCSDEDIDRSAGGPQACDRCNEDFDADELNDVGLCPGCEEAKDDSPQTRRLASELRAMSNTPYDPEEN